LLGAIPALALTCLLALPDVSFAQRRGFGGGGRGFSMGPGGFSYGSGGYGGTGFSIGQGGLSYGPNYGYGYGSGYGYGYPGYGYGYGSNYGGWGYGSNPGYYSSGWATPGYYGGGYSTYPSDYSWQGGTIAGGMNTGYQSFYPPSAGQGQYQGQGQSTDPNRALIRVQVRPDAQVTIDGSPTQQTGPQRVFVTPPLEGDGNYTYNISARWRDENGQEKTRSEKVRFSAGRTVDVNLMTAGQGTRPAPGSEELSEPNNPNPTNPPRPNTPPSTNPNNPRNPGQDSTPAPKNPGQSRPERQPD